MHVWNKLPVNHTFRIPPDTHYFGAESISFNYDFRRLMRTEPLFRGVKVELIDPFLSHATILLINVSSIGLPLTWRQISTLRWACWDESLWGTDLQLLYGFPNVLIWRCMVSFDAPSSLTAYEYFFAHFLPKLCSFSNLSVASPTSQIILQPFRRFTYVTAFSNPSVASPTSQIILQPFFRFFYVTGSSLNVTWRAAHAFFVIIPISSELDFSRST